MAMDADEAAEPLLVRSMKAIESATRLDMPVDALRPLARSLLASPARKRLLQGEWLGHGVHPMLTDFPLGAWMSASLLDVIGGRRSRSAATTLVGFGVVTALPTVLTGIAEWGETGEREQRVGVVHAASNAVALGLYTSSLRARLQGRHGAGAMLGIAGGLTAVMGGYLGGHLTEVRKVSSRHRAFIGPQRDGTSAR